MDSVPDRLACPLSGLECDSECHYERYGKPITVNWKERDCGYADNEHKYAHDEPNDHLGDSGPVDETDHGRDYRSLGNLAQNFDPGLYDPIRELCGSHLGIFAVCDYADFAIIQQT